MLGQAGHLTPLELPSEARATIYALASRLVLAEPDAALLDALRAPPALAVLERAAPGLSADLADWSPARAEETAVAFASLFLLPNGVPARAEAWVGPGGMRPLRAQVERALHALGRAVDHERGRLPDDHAALLFDLSAHLLRADPAHTPLADALLAPWIPRFAAALAKAEAPRLYLALGRLLTTLHPAAPNE